MKQNTLNITFYISIILLFITYCFTNAKELSHKNQFKFDYFFLDAIRTKQKNEHTQTFNTLEYIFKIDSLSPTVLYELSKYYLFLKKEELALNALQKAVTYDPTNCNYQLALAKLNQKLGNFNEAISIYKKLIKKEPQYTELYYYLVNLYIEQLNIDKAIKTLNKIEKNIGINEIISLQKIQLYKVSCKKPQSLKEIKILAKKFPTIAKYQILIGDFYLEEKKIEKALLYYKKARTIDSNNFYYFVAMSNYYRAKGNNKKSIKEIIKALNDNKLDFESKLAILGIFINNSHASNENKKIIYSLFEILIKQYSQYKKLNRIYGQFLLSQKKKEKAKIQFQTVIKSFPKDLEIWIQLLNIALQEKKPDEIISICKNALIYFPNIPEFYLYKGIAFFIKKAYQNALDSYLNGLKIISKNNTVLLSIFFEQIGDLYHQLDNIKKSFIYYQKAIQYNNKNIIALNNYAYYILLTKKNLDKAEKMAAKAIQIQPNNIVYIDTYAWLFFQKKNYSLAKFYIEKAIYKNDTMSSEILDHYRNILYKIGAIKKAILE